MPCSRASRIRGSSSVDAARPRRSLRHLRRLQRLRLDAGAPGRAAVGAAHAVRPVTGLGDHRRAEQLRLGPGDGGDHLRCLFRHDPHAAVLRFERRRDEHPAPAADERHDVLLASRREKPVRRDAWSGLGAPRPAARAPTNLAPPSGATEVAVRPTPTWTAATYALTYDVHLGRVSAGAPARVATVDAPTTTWTASQTLSGGQAYGWHIVAVNNAGAAAGALWTLKTAADLVALGTVMVPTLVQSETYARVLDTTYAATLDLSAVTAEEREEWNLPDLVRRYAITPADVPLLATSRSRQDLFVRRYVALGGSVVAGSDSPNQLLSPGASLLEELGLLVRAGLTPSQALIAATRDAARLVHADSIGVLKRGAVADFVILSASPLDDIRNVRQIELVISQGRRHQPVELRKWPSSPAKQ